MGFEASKVDVFVIFKDQMQKRKQAERCYLMPFIDVKSDVTALALLQRIEF